MVLVFRFSWTKKQLFPRKKVAWVHAPEEQDVYSLHIGSLPLRQERNGRWTVNSGISPHLAKGLRQEISRSSGAPSVNDFGSINIVLLWSTSRLTVLSTTTSHATPGATRPKLDS